MKTIEEILKQKPVYLHSWSGKDDVINDFEHVSLRPKSFWDSSIWDDFIPEEERRKTRDKPVNILFASYNVDNWVGDAFVLFEENGDLFEVNASHCSCYGLEGQFDPERTDLESLRYRLVHGKMGQDDYSGNEYAIELRLFLGIGNDN